MDIGDLAFVFGGNSSGDSPETRAMNSDRRFVRSQDHLAVWRPTAKGRILTAWEALKTFGFETLCKVVDEGTVAIVVDPKEPAATLRRRRERLGLDFDSIALASKVSEEDVRRSEDPDARNYILVLEKIARCYGLDERFVSLVSGSGGDDNLAIRLRTLRDRDHSFSERDILTFGEITWIISTQHRLQNWLETKGKVPGSLRPDNQYGSREYPAYAHGYYLASKTRDILGIRKDEPITSMRDLCESLLGIPLIQARLPRNVAGATLSSGSDRGIVVNTEGENQNEWVRRVTIAHELGHLLWDPNQRLENLKVDRYPDIDCSGESRHETDYVEQRANAFAIGFIAPSSAVRALIGNHEPTTSLRSVMEHFGLSFTSARYHVWNLFDRRHPLESFRVEDTEPTDEWKGRETFTLDYFEPSSVPFSRRGAFASLVVRSEKRSFISEQTAAEYLSCSQDDYRDHRGDIEQLHF